MKKSSCIAINSVNKRVYVVLGQDGTDILLYIFIFIINLYKIVIIIFFIIFNKNTNNKRILSSCPDVLQTLVM